MDDKYSVYDHLKAHDIIDALRPLLDSGAYKLRREDGKFIPSSTSISKDTPWIHVKHADGFNCGLWHQVIFNVISAKLPEGKRFVPRNCQNCWKVVVKPRTLQQLFHLLEIEKKLDRPSKCGIEVRDSVPGLYGGYFYNKGQEAGLECYGAICKALSENEVMAPLLTELDGDNKTTRIILKRACTEFEHAVGDSSKWEVTDEQNAIEDLVERYMAADNLVLTQPEHLIWDIKKRWIEWAWKNGDPTYALYTAGNPLYPSYVTYHPPVDATKT